MGFDTLELVHETFLGRCDAVDDNPIKEGWITVKQAARISGYTPQHIRKLAQDKRIHAKLIDAVYFIYEPSFRKYMDSQERDPRDRDEFG